jgi:hypothetical protein
VPSGPEDEPRTRADETPDIDRPAPDAPDEPDQPDESDELLDVGEPADDADPHTALPTKVESWRRRSATGAILTGFALGLQQVFETKKDEPAIVMETSGDPPRDLPVEAQVEQGRPRQSVVQIRPWLIESGGGRETTGADADRPAPSSDGPGDPVSSADPVDDGSDGPDGR